DEVEDAGGREAGPDGNAGEDALVGADHDDMAAGGAAPGGNEAGQDVLQAIDGRCAILPPGGETVEPVGEDVGERCDVAFHGAALLPGLVDDLDEGAEADGDEEGDDQGRYG